MDGRSLLISDVDGTLLGDDETLAAFADWHESAREMVRLVYASGRFFDSVVDSIHTTALPEPDAIIGGVGTEIREYPSGRPLAGWLRDVNGWNRLNICNVLSEFDELRMQNPQFLSDFKISYHVHDASAEMIDHLAQSLAGAGCRVELVYSSNRDLDVLPQHVNKGTAAEHLAEAWDFAREDVVVCGDSGNDRSMFEQGFRGVVVANAHDELRSLNSRDTYYARQSFAAGVLEGMAHWLRRDPGRLLV